LKTFALQAKATDQEIKALAKIIKQNLSLMEIIQITCNEEEEILETATQMKITFYDAAYTYDAKVEKLLLITEDIYLLNKITPHIKASKLNNIKSTKPKNDLAKS
jgi:predicted nucleic acid-binding protein